MDQAIIMVIVVAFVCVLAFMLAKIVLKTVGDDDEQD